MSHQSRQSYRAKTLTIAQADEAIDFADDATGSFLGPARRVQIRNHGASAVAAAILCIEQTSADYIIIGAGELYDTFDNLENIMNVLFNGSAAAVSGGTGDNVVQVVEFPSVREV